MNLCRYSDQISLPIPLDKGKYYYMETIMKDDHQNDHLEVGMQAPDGTNYTVIPSTFLRTSLPVPPSKSWRLCIVCYCLLCTVPQVTVEDFRLVVFLIWESSVGENCQAYRDLQHSCLFTVRAQDEQKKVIVYSKKLVFEPKNVSYLREL